MLGIKIATIELRLDVMVTDYVPTTGAKTEQLPNNAE